MLCKGPWKSNWEEALKWRDLCSSENDCKGECCQTALGAGPASVVKEDVWQYSDDWRNLNEYLYKNMKIQIERSEDVYRCGESEIDSLDVY